jgi:vacuolar-type H+-ATPase subunit H
MSGIETVKVIVEAEKEASRVVEDAQNRAVETRKQLDSLIQQQREKVLMAATKEATELVQKAQDESRNEAQAVEKEAQSKLRETLNRASTRKSLAVEKLVAIIMELKS